MEVVLVPMVLVVVVGQGFGVQFPSNELKLPPAAMHWKRVRMLHWP